MMLEFALKKNIESVSKKCGYRGMNFGALIKYSPLIGGCSQEAI